MCLLPRWTDFVSLGHEEVELCDCSQDSVGAQDRRGGRKKGQSVDGL